jgi:hypothetical protein
VRHPGGAYPPGVGARPADGGRAAIGPGELVARLRAGDGNGSTGDDGGRSRVPHD